MAVEAHREAVAEAIWRAGYPRDVDADRTWRDVVNKTHFRAQADAAIQALGLTEEQREVDVFKPVLGSQYAWHTRFSHRARQVRLVSEWVGEQQ